MVGCCRGYIVLAGLLACLRLNALTLGDVNRLFKQSKVLLEEGRQVAAKDTVSRVCELFSCADTEVMGIKDHIFHYSMSKCVLGAKECMSRIVANENIGSKNNETVMATAAAAWLLGGEGVGEAATFATAAAMKNRAEVASVNQQLVAQIDIYVTEFSMAYNNLSEKAKKAELKGVKDIMDHPLPNPLHMVKFNSMPTAIPIEGILEVAKKTDGNLKRQCLIIGVLYMDGLCNLPKDQNEAMKWIRASGYQDRMNEVYEVLAGLYLDEKESVVKRDPRKAMQWRVKAAENGDADAQFNLGVMLANGSGCEKDEEAEVSWYRKAAAQGHAGAQFNLGVMLANGCGCEKDEAAAVSWYRKAAAQGHADAQFNLGMMLANGRGCEKDETEAMHWRMKAAENGDAVDQYNIGVKFGHGTDGVKKDTDEAMKWYLKAAAQGYAAAENNIGWMYYVGDGMKKDYAEAVKWFKKAVAKNSRLAQESLGRCYYKGCGVERDYKEACRLFRLGAEQKDFCSMYGLAKCLYFGKGCEKNVPEALDWLIKAAEGGDRDAQYQFGELLERGESVRKDVQAAEKWYKAAATKEHKFAKLKGLGVEIPVKSGEDAWPWTDELPDDGAITCGAP